MKESASVKPCDNVLDMRPEVQLFAMAMETRLRENDAQKGEKGWDDISRWVLHENLVEEVGELRWAIDNDAEGNVLEEAADVGNFAMMIFDKAWLKINTPRGGDRQ